MEVITTRIRDHYKSPDPSLSNSHTFDMDWSLSASVNGFDHGMESIVVDVTQKEHTIRAILRDAVASIVSSLTGQGFTSADVKGLPAVRTGSVSIGILDASKAVTFDRAMPSTNYRASFSPQGVLAASFGISSKTTGGFTLNISVGVNGTVDYVAVED